MNWKTIGGAAITLGAMATLVMCAPAESSDEMRVVKVEGTESCKNYALSSMTHFKKPGDTETLGMVVRDGDLLLVDPPEHGMLLPYRTSDGATLRFSGEPGRLLLDGKTVSLTLAEKENGEAWKWLAEAKQEDLKSLRLVSVPTNPEEYTPEQIEIMERLTQANPEVYVFVDDTAILQPFLGEWVAALNKWKKGKPLDLGTGRGVEFLLLGDALTADEKKPWKDLVERLLKRESGLKTLMIVEKSDYAGPFPTGLRRLNYHEEGENLDGVKGLTELRELTLVEAKLKDMSALKGLKKLQVLSMPRSETGDNLSKNTAELPLKWISFPKDVSQEEFDKVIAEHPELEAIELAKCEGTISLDSLRDLKHLKALMLVDKHLDEADVATLGKMRELKLLAVTEHTSEEDVKEIEKRLPGVVVTEEGTCLGSGWILLLVPAIGVGLALRHSHRRRRSARAA